MRALLWFQEGNFLHLLQPPQRVWATARWAEMNKSSTRLKAADISYNHIFFFVSFDALNLSKNMVDGKPAVKPVTAPCWTESWTDRTVIFKINFVWPTIFNMTSLKCNFKLIIDSIFILDVLFFVYTVCILLKHAGNLLKGLVCWTTSEL